MLSIVAKSFSRQKQFKWGDALDRRRGKWKSPAVSIDLGKNLRGVFRNYPYALNVAN
jgi:hypothetical protein